MKTRFLFATIITVSIVLVVASVFAGNNKTASAKALAKDKMPGFTEITAVDGVSFFINERFCEKATAVTQVSNNISFQKNQYYSYKNGEDKYLLFNMNELIIAAQKGTNFNIEASEDKEQALLDSSMLNIWFSKGSKKLETETVNGLTSTIATAGVAINSTTYGDFCGKLANISKDGQEWSLFVGVPGERYDKLSDEAHKGIDTIINTFSFSDDIDEQGQNVYAVSLTGDASKTKVDTIKEVFEDDETSLNLSNQNQISQKEETKAYTSSVYNMLSINDNGLLSSFNDSLIKYEDVIICPTNVYRGQKAEDIIKNFCNVSNQYEYVPCPEGCSWEVLEYDLNYANCEDINYVNIKLLGVDGEILRNRGISYSSRTYDMTNDSFEDGNWIRHCYAYYAVPNGCYEYCLMAGESKSVTNEEVSAAYYHITGKE